jgi:hypothetical protein
MTAFNVVVSILGAICYGPKLAAGGTIINHLAVPWIRQSVILLTTANSLLSIILVINPLNQETEELFRVPQGKGNKTNINQVKSPQNSLEFGCRRVFVRSAVLFSILFVAESGPNFGPMLDFFAGSTVAMTSIIFPWLFHYSLCRRRGGGFPGKLALYSTVIGRLAN